ncbi:MAG: MFS transporter, partial [Gorillibacterium sp.]|nr:MFS transporter [Gorillibacterium sp.]
GLLSAVYGISSVLGPILGGYIVDNLEWHWVFWIFLPLGIAAFTLILKLFPKTAKSEAYSIDYLGSLFLTTTLVPLLLAFSWAGTKYAWSSVQIIGLFASSVLSLLIFLFIQGKAKNPVLPLFLFKNSIFTISNMVGLTLGAGMFGAIMYMPYFVQGVLGFSATASSYIIMPLMIAYVIGNMASGNLITRTGKYKILAIVGLLIMTGGLYLLSTMGLDTAKWTIMGFLMVMGIGMGLGMPIFSLAVQNSVEQRNLGVATAASQLFRSLGGTIGVSVFSTILANRLKDRMSEMSASTSLDVSKLDPEVAKSLSELKNIQTIMDPDKLEQIHKSLPADLQQVFVQLLHALRDAFSYSISGVFLIAAIIMLVATLLTLFLKEIPLRSSSKNSVVATEGQEQII